MSLIATVGSAKVNSFYFGSSETKMLACTARLLILV